MNARLFRPDGTVARSWVTGNANAALTSDRNCPPGWRVEIEKE